MTYTHSFIQDHVERYRTAPIARAVVSRMGGLPASYPNFSPAHVAGMKCIPRGILEIQECSDWGESYTDAPRYIQNHARGACERIEYHCNNWYSNTQGLRNPDAFAVRQIKGLRERIDPALYGIEKELDPTGSARAAYEAIENKAIDAINALFDPANPAAIPKSKVRAYRIDGIEAIMKSFAQDLQSWTDELVDCIT